MMFNRKIMPKLQRVMRRSAAAILSASAVFFLTAAENAPQRTNGDPWRLQYHFTPPHNWTNDPNGLVYYKGEYHLFYQSNPFGTKWGHMSWGHAVSTDLFHWKDLPIALAEENGIMMFSGSAVVDKNNSSRLCVPKNGEQSCLIAIYTGHTAERQTQNIAYSNDRGRTWTKYKQNPVIDLQLKDFRDPKVFWYEAGSKWVMVTALADQHKMRLFESHDLIHWNQLSDFGPAGATGGAWECPDLFPLPVQGTNESRWVLVVNINPGGVAGGSGTQYFIGQFDGKTFTDDNQGTRQLWADYGKDYYAAVSFFGHQPGESRRVMVGWFSNWLYANDTPEADWRGAMNLPREVSLMQTPDGIKMKQLPVREIRSLRKPIGSAEAMPVAENKNLDLTEANRQLQAATRDGRQLEIEVVFEAGQAQHFGVNAFQSAAHRTAIGVDRSKSILYLDRSQSGVTNFSAAFPGKQIAPLRLNNTVKLDIYLDRSSVEVFVNDGEVTMADRVYPGEGDTAVSLFADGESPKVRSLRMWRINSIWDNNQTVLPQNKARIVPVSQ